MMEHSVPFLLQNLVFIVPLRDALRAAGVAFLP